MNKKQYNNIIEHSLQYDCKDTTNSLDTARIVFNNMGVALPKGTIKEVYDTVSTNDYMGWRHCNFEKAKEAANNGIAAMGINQDRIVVLSAEDTEQSVAQTASVLTLTDNTPAVAVANLQYYIYNYDCTTCTTCTSPYVPTNDRYLYELKTTFGFSEEVANLIRTLYYKVECVFFSENNITKAWKCARMLSEFVYDADNVIDKWDDVAGSVADADNRETYFINTLGYTNQQYTILSNALIDQHRIAGETGQIIDFCHMQYSIAARLAYTLNKDGFKSNLGTGIYTGNYGLYTDEEISYLAGWLGDAVLTNIYGVGTTLFGNDDYMSDLDAENIYRLIIQDNSSITAINLYYSQLTNCCNRADTFLQYISYSTVQEKVFYELVDAQLYSCLHDASEQGEIFMTQYYLNLINDEQYHWDTIKSHYPNTYDFLKSLNDRRATMQHY